MRSWNWPTWLRRVADPIGVGQGEHAAGTCGVDVGEHQMNVGAPGDVERSIAQPLDGAPVGAVVAGVAGDQLHAQREVAGQLVGPAAQHVALVDDRGDHARQRSIGRQRGHHHPSQTRVQRQLEHRPAVLGDRAVGVERIEHAQQLLRRLHRLRRRWIEERQVGRLGVPRGQLERQIGQLDLRDLGREVREARALLELAPQPVADARLGAAGASGALIGRGAAGGDRRQPAHAGAHVEARHASQAGVDDDRARRRRSATTRRCRC